MRLTIHKAKTHLSRILHEVQAGQEVTILRGTVPVAKIVPLSGYVKRRPPVGQPTSPPFKIHENAFAPLSEKEMSEWGIR
jgi:prevent-host-death family protein